MAPGKQGFGVDPGRLPHAPASNSHLLSCGKFDGLVIGVNGDHTPLNHHADLTMIPVHRKRGANHAGLATSLVATANGEPYSD